MTTKIDYSKEDITHLELFLGKPKAHLLVKLSNLEIKVYNDSVDEYHYYHSNDIPYIQHHVNSNEVSFNPDLLSKYNLTSNQKLDTLEYVTKEVISTLANPIIINEFNEDLYNIIDITSKIKTLEDACKIIGIPVPYFEPTDNGLLLTNQANLKLMIITQALNGIWTPDWTNSNHYKYFPYFKMGDSSGVGFASDGYIDQFTYSAVASRLCFHSSELCKYSVNQFMSIYKQYFII